MTLCQAFLQVCANRGTIEKQEVLEIFDHLYKKYNDTNAEYDVEEKLKEIITRINSNIKNYDQQIKFVKHDLLENEYIVFVNTVEASINKHQKHYTEADINYFFLILKEIITSEDYCIRPIVALNLTSELKIKSFTRNHAEERIEEWINQGYLVIQEDIIYFGSKAISEFQQYFKRNFSDYITECSLCRMIIFRGSKCDHCGNLFHNECINKYTGKTLKCPTCKENWKQHLYF